MKNSLNHSRILMIASSALLTLIFIIFSIITNDEIINKVLDEVEDGQLTDATIGDTKRGLNEIKEGKGESIEKVAKEFGVKL